VARERVFGSSPQIEEKVETRIGTLTFFDLKKDGPIVVEVPKGSGPGTVNDAFFRFVIDMGGPGQNSHNHEGQE